MEYMICTTDELRHHGTKGMRWGIRRWQNKDGSLTPAGKKRRDKLENKLKELHGVPKKGDVPNPPPKPRRKTASEMTDDELDAAIARARKEDTYRQLRPEPKPKESFAKRLFNEAIKPAAVNAGKDFLDKSLNQAVEKLFKGKVDPNSIEALTKVRDKAKLRSEIRKYNDLDFDVNWENKLKRQTWEKNERERKAAEAEAAEKKAAADKAAKEAKKAEKEAAKQAKKDAKQQAWIDSEKEKFDKFQEEYRKSLEPKPDTSEPYRNKGGERTSVDPDVERGLTIYRQSPVTSLATHSNVDTGKSYVIDVLSRTGETIRSYDSNDDVLYRRDD